MTLKNSKILRSLILILFFAFSIQTHARTVSELVVEETGLHTEGRKDKSEEIACKVFTPTKKQLIRYFNLAKESKESGNILHEYYSPCLSTGLIKFEDGASGNWVLQSSGFGYVTFSNNETTYFFHNPDNQWTDPYACSYGLSDEPSC